MRLNARELRTNEPDPQQIKNIKKNPVYIILDNVLDTYNVGAIFRLADAVAAQKVYLCGQTEKPPNPRIKKASINTWRWINWEHADDAVNVIKELRIKNQELRILAVEQDKRSIPLSELKIDFPVAVVVGNETYGVAKEVLDIADVIVELPMYGINKSLNVMVTLGIVLYKLIDFLPANN